MKIGRNDLCPCGSGRKYKNCPLHAPAQPGVPGYAWRALVNFAVFLGLAEVEPTTKDRHDRHYRVRNRPLLAEAVRIHIPR